MRNFLIAIVLVSAAFGGGYYLALQKPDLIENTVNIITTSLEKHVE